MADMSDDALFDALSVDAIKLAAQPFCFPRKHSRNRAAMLSFFRIMPSEVRERILNAARETKASKESKKRRSDAECQQRFSEKQKRARLDQRVSTHNVEEFLDLPSPQQTLDCRQAFLDATSNESLAQGVCASCARQLLQNEMVKVDYHSLPNRHLFEPANPHPAQTLVDGMLLVHEHLVITDNEVIGWLCRHCETAVNRNRLPALTLSNGMWVGATPPALAMLTVPEQLLIALRYCRGYVYKLFPKTGRGTDHPETLQSALKGNVTTYTANVQDVVRMLEGELMPRRTTILADLVAVTFVGKGKLSKSKLKSLFRVRRKVVHAALLELKHVTKHPGYVDLDIDEGALSSLPEDGIPPEILLTIRREEDVAVVERESAGYVPPDVVYGKFIFWWATVKC
jgi:hypothetical protein